MQELLVQEQIELELHVYVLVQMTLLICHVTEDRCRNLPFGRRETQGSQVRLPREENERSRHQRLFEESVRKIGTCCLRTLSVKGSGVVFTHGEGISTPRIRHKGRQPLIKCAIS